LEIKKDGIVEIYENLCILFFNNASYLMSYSFHFSPHHISFSHSRVVQQAVAAQGAGDGHDPLHQRRRLRCGGWRRQRPPTSVPVQASPVKDRLGEPERGSEWEPIKILLEEDENSNKTKPASKTRLQLNYPSWSRPRNHWSVTGSRNQQPPTTTQERSGTSNSSTTDLHQLGR
jgi:hypothetical protein